MVKEISNLEIARQNRRTQVDAQRVRILDAAEECFLQKGIENTRMSDIAARAGITRVSLYRYYSDRDELALEIHARMINRIANMIPLQELGFTYPALRRTVRLMLTQFDSLRDEYRFMGMFDALYLDHPAGDASSRWDREHLPALLVYPIERCSDSQAERAHIHRVNVVISAVIWFLEKLAMRGELTWSDPSIPLDDHLVLFEEIIIGYIDRFVDPSITDS